MSKSSKSKIKTIILLTITIAITIASVGLFYKKPEVSPPIDGMRPETPKEDNDYIIPEVPASELSKSIILDDGNVVISEEEIVVNFINSLFENLCDEQEIEIHYFVDENIATFTVWRDGQYKKYSYKLG